jgi:signal transduction protein with GAF and PtsI domain
VTPDSQLMRSVAAVRTLFDAAACSCALVDDDGSALHYVAADGEGAAQIIGVELPIGRGIAGWAVMSGQPLAVSDVRSDPRFAQDIAAATNYVPTSIVVAPLFDEDGEALGVLSVLDPTADQTTERGLAVLGTLATQIGMLVTARRQLSDGPGDSRLETLGRLVVEAVDDYRG